MLHGGIFFMKVNVFYQEKCIGQANVLEDGLYLCVDFSFLSMEEKLLRLKAFTKANVLDLGILLYHSGGYHMHTAFPKKKLGAMPEYMCIENGKSQEVFKIPIAADKPFPALEHLEHAHLMVENGGQLYICME